MSDPLADVISLLQPGAPFSKLVSGAGAWCVRRDEEGQPFYAVVLEGSCVLAVDGHAPLVLGEGDFVLIPAARGFTMHGAEPAHGMPADTTAVLRFPGEIRHGVQDGPPEVRLRVGHCVFGSPDAALLVSLLPTLVHVRGEGRLATLAQLVGEESRQQRPAREMILGRLLEVLLIEALRSAGRTAASPGLVRALADERLAVAVRHMHESPARPWTVAQLAREAALSRSAFFQRFSRAVGASPMAYLLAWRMALAKRLLRKGNALAEVAERVGYSSAGTFSVAFTRHVGQSPARYARTGTDDAPTGRGANGRPFQPTFAPS